MTQKLEAREKQTDTGVEVEHTHDEVTITKGNNEIHVDSHVFTVYSPSKRTEADSFTRKRFEDALDKVSRPLKGRLAHVPYSSEDFIREKREEAELEDRPS